MTIRSTIVPYALSLVLGLLCLLFFLGAVDVFNKNVALYHDAVWDFIPAVAMVRAKSILRPYEVRIFHHPVPIVSGPYSGALKIWLLAPLVKILPSSPRIILTLNAFLGFIYLLALYWALLPVVGKIWASIAFAAPFVDTNLLITVPVDAGIALTQYIFISLALGAFFRYISNPQVKYYRATFFLLGCLLAQKLTALPIAIGLMIVLAAFSLKHFLEAARARTIRQAIASYFVIPVTLFVIPLLFQLYYFLRHGFTELYASTADGKWRPYLAALRYNFSGFFTLFDGWDWYHRLTLDDRPEMVKTPFLSIFGLAVIGVSLAIYFLSRRNRGTGRNAVLCLAIGSFSFLLYPAFRGLYRPWHFYVLAPVFLCCLVMAAHHVFHWAGQHIQNAVIVRAVLGAILIFLVSVSTLHSFDVLKQLRSRKGVCIASPAFYDFYNSISKSNIKLVYAVNYSLAYPIYVLSKGTIPIEELAWTKLTPDKMEELIRKVKMDSGAAIAYRYCGCRDSESAWVQWLNREPELLDFIKRLEAEAGGLSMVRFRDDRQTEFVLVSRKGPGIP